MIDLEKLTILDVIESWQSLVDVLADLMDVPAALIMKISDEKISVSVRSNTIGNPYHVGDSEKWFDSGLYCETVIRSQQKLFISNALEDKEWKNNPDIKLNMINYLGYPIKWPAGEPFGTLCVLDYKTHHYSDSQHALMFQLKNSIEVSLQLFEKNKKLQIVVAKLAEQAQIDELTGILNRREFFERAEQELRRSKRNNLRFCILMLDIDYFKQVNDLYGHDAGDLVLKEFCKSIQAMKRSEDSFGRVGGEEFLILLPLANLPSAKVFAERVLVKTGLLRVPVEKKIISLTTSIGCTEYYVSDVNLKDILIRADKALYKAKELGRNQVYFNIKS